MGLTLLNPAGCIGSGYGGYGGDCYECDGWCPGRCLDYNRLWQVDVSNVNIFSISPAGGTVSAGERRWGWVDIDLSGLNGSHYMPLTKSPITGSFPKSGPPYPPCNFASGTSYIELGGSLYLSDLVSYPPDIPPTEDQYRSFPFTLTLGTSLTIYDQCGQRTSAVSISFNSLMYDDTDVEMTVYGNGIHLTGEYEEREACNVLPLTHDDIWFNSNSFFGYSLTGYRKDDTTSMYRSLWKAGSGLYSSQLAVGSSGTMFVATPL